MTKQSSIETIREELKRRKNRIGLVGTRLNVGETGGNSLEGSISTDWKEININFGKDLELVPDMETTEFARKRDIMDAKMTAGEDILEHEAGHRENKVGERLGCPYDLWTHERIKEKISQGLSEVDRKGLEHYVTNAFEDVLNNVNCRRHTDFAGQTLFWNNQGLVKSQNQKFNPFYESFVKLNLLLGGRASDNTLLSRFYSNTSEASGAVSLFTNELKSASEEQSLVRLHSKCGFQRLFNPQDLDARAKSWADLGYKFAIYFGKLLDKSQTPNERMFASREGDENSPEQNPFDKEMKIPGNRQRIAQKRYEQGLGFADHRDVQEQLFDLYKSISKKISIQTTHYTASQSMPIVHFGRRFVREDEEKFRFRGIGVKEDGGIGIRISKHNISYPVTFKKHKTKFPNFKLALMDRSGSMALNSDNEDDVGRTECIPWGDKSKYHFALKGYFGIDNFLEQQGVLPYIESCALGFSGEEAIRGRSSLVAKSLLTSPSGDTSLDVSNLERELENNAFVLSISDGAVSPSQSEKTRFEAKIQDCDYAHIQIGSETNFSSYLRGLGVPVIFVRGDDDLSKAMISFVSDYYKPKPVKGGIKVI